MGLCGETVKKSRKRSEERLLNYFYRQPMGSQMLPAANPLRQKCGELLVY
jgi:hypothetical protein